MLFAAPRWPVIKPHIPKRTSFMWRYSSPQHHCYFLCGTGGVAAVNRYLDKGQLSALIPRAPPLLFQALGCLGPQFNSMRKPKPSLPPSLLLRRTMETCFLPPLPQIKHTHRHILKCTYLILQAVSHWSEAVAIRCPGFFVCSFVLTNKDRPSLSTSRVCSCFSLLLLFRLVSLSILTFIATLLPFFIVCFYAWKCGPLLQFSSR